MIEPGTRVSYRCPSTWTLEQCARAWRGTVIRVSGNRVIVRVDDGSIADVAARNVVVQ